MHSPFLKRSGITQLAFLISVAFTILFLFSGCALKPWDNPLTNREIDELTPLTDTMRELQDQCSPCLDGNVKISIKNQFGGRKLNGYIMVARPDRLKFVAHNPFGQPVIALSGETSSFHYLDTMNRVVLIGQPLLICREIGIPEVFASDSWGLWLTGSFPREEKIIGMKTDKDRRGVWLSFPPDASGLQEHILIIPKTYRVASRIITRNKGINLRLDYHYEDQLGSSGLCGLPQKIAVSGFDYSTEVKLEFSDVEVVDMYSPADFDLPEPVDYTIRKFQEETH